MLQKTEQPTKPKAMTKPDDRQTLRPKLPPQPPALAVKTAPKASQAPAIRTLEPCNTCRWRLWDAGTHRCHVGPPQVRFPYDNMACWPVVPSTGGGCREWSQIL